ncbi:hypothetical protein DRJ48_02695 [Candidatus Woesearchaeota archaeon]|nr:MAG: hypothetical protein DRJ48_02695 [Candidatus Woesearchaeota archaeon]
MKLSKSFVGSGSNIILFFPFWGGKPWHYKILYRFLCKSATCVFYDYSTDILSSDVEATRENIIEVLNDARSTIEDYKRASVFGSSLGSFIALLLAASEPKVEKIVLNTGGASLAEAVWLGEATKNIKKRLEEKGWSLTKLKEAWSILEPNLLAINNRLFLIMQSLHDNTILKENQMRLLEQLCRNNLVTIVNTRLGHRAALIRNLLRIPTIARFLWVK